MLLWRSGPQALGEFGSKPEVSLPRRLPAVCSGYRHYAYTSRRERRHDSVFLVLRFEPLHRAALGLPFDGLRFAALCFALLVLAAVELEQALAAHVRVEHFQGSAAGVDLIIMREIGEAFEHAK